MQILLRVMNKLGAEAMMIFIQAFDYYEMHISPDEVNNIFNACIKEVDGERRLVMMPRVVMLYCVDVLSNFATPLTEDSQIPPLEEYKK